MTGSSGDVPVLSVRGLGHHFGERAVLRGVDFDLARGEVLGILGPNGSGKSTALAVLAGLLARQDGEVRWQGEPLPTVTRAFRASLGVVFQSPAVDVKLTARHNLLLAGRLHGLPRDERRPRADELLALAGLTARADDRVSEYSGGMRRRLDLARALLHRPSLLLMDEPTTGLDEAAFRDTWQRLDDLRRGEHVSLLVSTHRAEEAERCDRIAILTGGRVVAIDTPDALRAEVASDVVALRGGDADVLAKEVRERFDLSCLVHSGEVVIDCERGHELIPRLVESFPEGRLASVSLRRPTLADVFLKVTGRALDDEAEEQAA